MFKQWRLADILDLFFLLDRDKQEKSGKEKPDLNMRDRSLYLQFVAPALPSAERKNPRRLLLGWVHARRKKMTNAENRPVLPGELWQEIDTGMRWLFLAIGLFFGISVAVPVLSYSGKAPINVTLYFFLFVGVQAVLLALQLSCLLMNRIQGKQLPASLLLSLVKRSLLGVLEKQLRKPARKRGASRLESLYSIRLAMQKHAFCTPLFLWSVFLWLQLLGAGFNGGVVLATLGKVLVTDTAFGWQSTLQIDAAQLSHVVQWIALPWSWLVPDHLAYPSLEAVQGSKMVLKEGLYLLETSDLVSWWPFLCCAVTTYGLLPRIALYIWSRRKMRALLSSLPPLSTAMHMVLHRMTTEVVKTDAAPVVKPAEPERKKAGRRNEPLVSTPIEPKPKPKSEVEPTPVSTPAPELQLEPAPEPQTQKTVASEMPADIPATQSLDDAAVSAVSMPEDVVLLVPDEIYDDIGVPSLMESPQPHSGLRHTAVLRYGELGGDKALFDDLRQRKERGDLLSVTLLTEGWQPPIQETLYFLSSLRNAAGKETGITLWLLGKPTPRSFLTPAREEDVVIWQKKITGLLDPYLEIVSFSHA